MKKLREKNEKLNYSWNENTNSEKGYLLVLKTQQMIFIKFCSAKQIKQSRFKNHFRH